MDREQFLRELDDIKNGRKSQNLAESGTSVCNRLYSALVECLAMESKNVEAKLQVLTSALCYYVELRPHYEVMSPEADAFGHFLFMECSRLVLGIEFHHLKNEDSFKLAFKNAIGDIYHRLQDYAIGQVFLVLEWLMVNQWNHPTLVAMMKGEDIEKERALTYIRSGEYPELFRLRVEMLMESGCDNFASNLVSWCIQSPLFENDVPLRATHLILLYKLGRHEQLHSQCCQMSCCMAKEILKHLITRSEEPPFLLLMTQTFLLLNWIKPGEFCCTKELLEYWLRLQHEGEPEDDKFLDSINKVVVLTQDVQQILIFLEVMIEMFETKFIQFCTELALTSVRKERHHRHDTSRIYQKDVRETEDATDSLVQICKLIGKLYQHHPQMHLACLLTVLYLEPTDVHYYAVESYFKDLSDMPPVESQPPADVDHHKYRTLHETIELLRPAKFHPKFGWKEVKAISLSHVEDAGGYKYDVEKNVLQPVLSKSHSKREKVYRHGKLVKISAYLQNDDQHSPPSDNYCPTGEMNHEFEMTADRSGVHFSIAHHLTDDELKERKEFQMICGDGWVNADGLMGSSNSASLSSQKLVAISDEMSAAAIAAAIYHQAAASVTGYSSSSSSSADGGIHVQHVSSGHPAIAKMHVGFTLDDIQQVLSATQTVCDGGSSTGGSDIPMDERALREITAFLQSELGRHPDGMALAGLYSAIHSDGSKCSSVSISGSNHASVSILPHRKNSRSTTLPSSSSSSSQRDPFPRASLASRQSTMVIPHGAFQAPTNCIGSTILVTESNLPYLQQFLPNLQTVMKSVQSLVRGVPHQKSDAATDSIVMMEESANSSDDISQSQDNSSSFNCLSQSELCIEEKENEINSNDVLNSIDRLKMDKQSPLIAMETRKDLGGEVVNIHEKAMNLDGKGLTQLNGKFIQRDIETSDKFYCRFCKRRFQTMFQRRRHIERMCQKKKKPSSSSLNSSIKCHFCGKCFVSKSGHATHVIRVHRDAKSSHPLNSGSNVKCPTRGYFIKNMRMDKDIDSSSEVSLPDDDHNYDRLSNSDDRLQKDELCMCDICGEIFRSYEKLACHIECCKVILPLEISNESHEIVNESSSILAGRPVIYNNTNSTSGHDVFQPQMLPAKGNNYFVQNRSQFGTSVMSGPTCVKQGPVFEMLQLAEHFLKHRAFVVHNTTTKTMNDRRPERNVTKTEMLLRPKVEPDYERDVMTPLTQSNFIQPQVIMRTKSMTAELGNIPTVMYSQQSLKEFEIGPIPTETGNLWPKEEASNGHTVSPFHSGLKPDVIMDGCLSVGKEIVYEGTRMNEYVEYQCETCLLTFSDSVAANVHIEGSDHCNSTIASYHVYVCTDCNIKYRDKQVMRNHILYICTGALVTSQQQELFKCNLCTKAFISTDFLQSHLNLKHGVKNMLNAASWTTKSPSNVTHADHYNIKNKEILMPFGYNGLIEPSNQLEANSSNMETLNKVEWTSDAAAAAVNVSTPQQLYLLSTPSAVSIPTLEQLTSGYGNTISKGSTSGKDLRKFPDLASSHQTYSLDLCQSGGGGSVPDILASIPSDHVDGQKQMRSPAEVRQMVNAQVSLKQRSSKTKGILYKNVFMQCEGTYFCSVCKADLSTRDSKKTHRQMPCGDPKTITYSRKYSYLCPYCVERFPSQKTCRQHQVSECLPLIGISTEELCVKELVCPLCPKKYFNLIPLKGHMTQVHKLPKAETRDMLLRLGYMETCLDGHVKNSSEMSLIPDGDDQVIQQERKDFVVSGDHFNSTDVEFVQRSMLFDFENDVSSECVVQGQDVLIQNSCEQCPEMEVIYNGEIFLDHEDKKLKGDDDVDLGGADDMEMSSAMLVAEEGHIGGRYPGKSSALGMDHYLSNWTDVGNQLPVGTAGGGNSASAAADNPRSSSSYLQETPADSTVSPEQRRRKPKQANEFFIMMFRNYPILAKGVSVCIACQTQMSSNSEVENHVSSAICTGPDGRPADVKRSTIFKCTHCDKTFWKAKTCRQHQLDTCLPLHGIDVDNLLLPSVACPLCAAKSYNRSGLMSHMKYKHSMDTKGVRDIMEQYGIHKKTADLLTPSLLPLHHPFGKNAMLGVALECVPESGNGVSIHESMNHPLKMDGSSSSSNEKLYTLENVKSVHFIKAAVDNNHHESSVAGDSCQPQLTPNLKNDTKTTRSVVIGDDQYDPPTSYTTIETFNKERDHHHSNAILMSFNSVT